MSVSLQCVTFALSFCQRQSMESLDARRRFHGERSPPHPLAATLIRRNVPEPAAAVPTPRRGIKDGGK